VQRRAVTDEEAEPARDLRDPDRDYWVSRSGCGRGDMANEETVKDHLPVKFPQMQVFCL
jgi:hypothetical protein